MVTRSPVFEKTYSHYLKQLACLDFQQTAPKLGGRVDDDAIIIPFFGQPYRVSPQGISDPHGLKPSFSHCIILFKYLLMCPADAPRACAWTAYRDLKDSGPLTVYFANEAQGTIAAYFSGQKDALAAAGRKLGGYASKIDAAYELALQFDVLPRVPVLLLYNDTDDEFAAQATILFEQRAEHYLDAESLAVLGRLVYTELVGLCAHPSDL